MNYRLLAGFMLAFSIGIVCRIVNIPLPAPPVFVGAMVVLAITLGYRGSDWLLLRREPTAQSDNLGES